jgi:hypothetical protein
MHIVLHIPRLLVLFGCSKVVVLVALVVVLFVCMYIPVSSILSCHTFNCPIPVIVDQPYVLGSLTPQITQTVAGRSSLAPVCIRVWA